MSRFIILGAGKNKQVTQNPSTINVGHSNSFLSWQHSTSNLLNCSRLDYVGGYKLDTIENSFKERMNITVNPIWEKTNAFYSLLLLDFDPNQDIYITYNDVLIDDDFILKTFSKTPDDITCLIDHSYPKRYANNQEINCESIVINNKPSEFVGFIHIPKRHIPALLSLKEKSNDYKDYNLSRFVNLIQERGNPVQFVDTNLNWCDANFPEALPKFLLKGKGKTLENLKKISHKSKFLDQVIFTSHDWHQNPEKQYEKVRKIIKSPRLAIRSSSHKEDGFLASNAGVFTSHLDIPLDDFNAFSDAVEATIDSYKNGYSTADHILVQPYIDNATIHGVVFTRTHFGGPYYVFNYSYDNDTSAITGGTTDSSQTCYFYRNADTSYLHKDLYPIYESIQEIEEIIGYDELDIEFIYDNQGTCYIVQVRPQVSHKHEVIGASTACSEALETVTNQFNATSPTQEKLFDGLPPIYAVMPDWNPAEIIGRKPLPLALSLYEELVTNNSWALQRHEFGYMNLEHYPLMTHFYGMPYIDVRASFLSFVPKDVPRDTALKIVKLALNHLCSHPHLHDKVEFEVMPTCYVWNFRETYAHIFDHVTDDEYNHIERAYKSLTISALSFSSGKEHYHPKLSNNGTSLTDLPSIIENCKKGVLAFAHEARKAFIATHLLKSLVQTSTITNAELDDFLKSIMTVSSHFIQDAYRCHIGEYDKTLFTERYGHLRPGTYDITAPRYDSDPETFITPMIEHAKKPAQHSFTWNSKTREKVERALESIDRSIGCDAFITFCQDSIAGREQVKFDFTKDLSHALELIADFGQELGIDRDSMAYTEYSLLKSMQNRLFFTNRNKTIISNFIQENRQIHDTARKIELPVMITKMEDMYCFHQSLCQPNFITSKHVMGAAVVVDHNYDENLNDKIVLIESADPGYEWIFSENIKGLITMYGGINSHMAVRSSELGLPAAIGIGEKTFEEVCGYTSISLDCQNKWIKPL